MDVSSEVCFAEILLKEFCELAREFLCTVFYNMLYCSIKLVVVLPFSTMMP